MSAPRTLLLMAGGTGGHIMPGLAVAQLLREQGWRVLWLGDPQRMEGRLVPAQGFELLALHFSGVRGKGLGALVKLPVALAVACVRAVRLLRRHRPDVVLGMGGYIAVPGGLMAWCLRIPLVVHEQNAVAGSANRLLARFARRALTGFPGVLPGATAVGNPVRAPLWAVPPVAQRYGARRGPLQLLVLGGSLGASALNALVPQTLARMTPAARPHVRHQTGRAHLDAVRAQYAACGVDAELLPFIDDMAEALAQADLVICRAGAMTVAEVAAVGVAALFVPLPGAIDDHQSANARHLADAQAAWMMPQHTLEAATLATWLAARTRAGLMQVALRAREHARPDAAADIARACTQICEEGA